VVMYEYICIMTCSGCKYSNGLESLDGQGLFPGGARHFSCLYVIQTGSGDHPAPVPVGTEGVVLWGWVLTPSSAEVMNGGVISPLPHMPAWHGA
jgi:hypothetical protein